jgi:phosphoadenosine phosphosulfate reductase
MAETIQPDVLNKQAGDLSPREILVQCLALRPATAIAFSGAEDVVLIAMAVKINPDIPVFTLDTGRLHPQTYRFIEEVRNHYRLNLEVLTPDREPLEKLVREKGLLSFYEDGHQECCEIRKINPLRRKLVTLDCWITGQRRDQSPTRAQVPVYQKDPNFRGKDGEFLKVNPLANWTLSQVRDTIRLLEIPYNPLHDKGFISIGCEPCARATSPGQHEREGRWWWEEATAKECGLHRDNLTHR